MVNVNMKSDTKKWYIRRFPKSKPLSFSFVGSFVLDTRNFDKLFHMVEETSNSMPKLMSRFKQNVNKQSGNNTEMDCNKRFSLWTRSWSQDTKNKNWQLVNVLAYKSIYLPVYVLSMVLLLLLRIGERFYIRYAFQF